jgi:gliding motility-associated-like protein
VDFTHNDSLCITENSFNFDGTVSGPPNITVINWEFGPNASIQTSNQEDVNNVVYSQPGVYPVTLTASFNSCSETATSTVTIFREPTINFGIDSNLRCAPYLAQFIDLSISDTPIQYLWDFGDGSTSTLQNPGHIYTEPGIYDVSLQIETNEGCIAALEMIKPNFLEVHPSPVSKFSVSPEITDICNSKITFTDLSSGAISYVYLFNDKGTGVSELQNPIYYYTTSGQKYPQQIVTNEFGCTDTSFVGLYIEPFTVYIPNTFTPDGDEFNNIFNAIIYLKVSYWSFKVFDRWGELLFESNDPEYGWDGTYGGKLVQDDTYTYVLKYVSCEDYVKPHVITGHVNVLK